MSALLHKEWLALIRDGRLWIVGLLLFLILGGFLLTAVHEYRQAQAERQTVEAQTRAQWDHQGQKGAHAGAHFGLYAFAPLTALGQIEPGIQRHNGQAIWLEPHKRNLPRFGEAGEQGPAQRLGEMTAGFVLWALVPLLIMGVAFGAVSGEREQGTLRMLHSLGLNPRQLLLAKLLAVLGALMLILLPALLVGLGLLGFGGLERGEGARAVIMLFTLILYYGLFAALALGLSSWLPSSRLTLLALLGFWLLGVLVAPRLAASSVQAISPLPTAEAFWNDIRHDINQGMGEDGDRPTRLAQFEQQVLEQYGVQSLEQLPVGFPALRRNFLEAYAKTVHDHHFDALHARMDNQKNQTLWASLLGPSHAQRLLTMSLAGTDLSHQRHFEWAAETYRYHFISLTDEWDAQRTEGLRGGGQADNADWQSIVHFHYSPPGAGQALRTSWRELLILLAWLALAAGFLLHAAGRLKP